MANEIPENQEGRPKSKEFPDIEDESLAEYQLWFLGAKARAYSTLTRKEIDRHPSSELVIQANRLFQDTEKWLRKRQIQKYNSPDQMDVEDHFVCLDKAVSELKHANSFWGNHEKETRAEKLAFLDQLTADIKDRRQEIQREIVEKGGRHHPWANMEDLALEDFLNQIRGELHADATATSSKAFPNLESETEVERQLMKIRARANVFCEITSRVLERRYSQEISRANQIFRTVDNSIRTQTELKRLGGHVKNPFSLIDETFYENQRAVEFWTRHVKSTSESGVSGCVEDMKYVTQMFEDVKELRQKVAAEPKSDWSTMKEEMLKQIEV